ADRSRTGSRAAPEAGRGRRAARRGVLHRGGAPEAPDGVRGADAREGPRMIRRAARRGAVAGLALSVAAVLTGLGAGAADALERLPAVLHVHSDLSTGDFSLEQLTAMAEKPGIA